MLKRLWRRYAPNPLDRVLNKAKKQGKKRILIAWNRGLGDIPLGLYAMVHRIRQYIPDAEIVFVTRQDLREGFELLYGVRCIVDLSWKRGEAVSLVSSLEKQGIECSSLDLLIPSPDPTWWVRWQIGSLIPRLAWNSSWDHLWRKFSVEGQYVGMHIQTETQYGYEKNWPLASWLELIEILGSRYGKKVLLFGLGKKEEIDSPYVYDLRGETSLKETLSLIRHCCSHLVVPDSGILSIVYYIDEDFPIRIVSLWADPRQGVLKQNVSSPNPRLIHLPILAENEKICMIPVSAVEKALGFKEGCG